MKKVIQNLTKILLDEEKIKLYCSLFIPDREYIIYSRTKLLEELINIYNSLNYSEDEIYIDKYLFNKEKFDFNNKDNIYRIERLYIKKYIN